MATQFAPVQRNFITISTTSDSDLNSIIQTSSAMTTSPSDTPTSSNSSSGNETTINQTTIPLHIIPQKKFILQTGTTSEGLPIIDVVPIDNGDSNGETPIAVSAIVTSDSESMSPTNLSVANDAQQVALVQAQGTTDSGTHFITVSAEGAVRSYAPLTTVVAQQDETYHVQYVDSELYANTGQGQTQMTYPVYAVGDYGTNGQQYYTTTGNYTHNGATVVNHAGGAQYIVPIEETILTTTTTDQRDSPHTITTDITYIPQPAPKTPTTSESECTPNLTHATRISPATVAWLVENYETAEGVSLPRSTLYNHYMRHCNEHKLDAVNAASFGKLIRSVFTGLRTRRLGTRGNSKYHYYGIRVKPDSGLMSNVDEKQHGNTCVNNNNNNNNNMNNNNSNNNQLITPTSNPNTTTPMHRNKKCGTKSESYETCSQYLGDGSVAIPEFPSINIMHPFPDDITFDDVDTLRSIYREHCEAFLDAILNLEFSTIESLWREFWRAEDTNNNGDECEEEKYLSKFKLYSLSQCEAVQTFMSDVDFIFYQNMVDVLIPDVLRPIPSSLTQAIRNFAKNLENWLSSAMIGCPEKIVQIKISSVSAFSQTLRRYTSLNHLAQAARAVLQNNSQISQMLSDLNRVDFRNVQEQASWVCQCDTVIVQRLENDFKAALLQQNSLEQWASWLRLVVDDALEQYRGKPTYTKAARQFLLKWSFYSSMVIRDLTLRSAASFGSFHLIRLLYDEYMFYIIEHKVAEATNTTPIGVMGKFDRRISI